MAPLPFNNTDIMTYVYRWDNGTSQFQVRYDGTLTTVSAVNNAVTAFINELGGILDDQWEIISARRQEKNSLISIPEEIPTGIAITGSSQSVQDRPKELCFVGRSAGGRRAEISIYGITLAIPENWRYSATLNTEIAGAVGVLNENGLYPAVFQSIDGLRPLWYPYANVNFNSYWERRARR